MDSGERFTLAVREAGISRVLVIDDALAPPQMREEDAGPLIDLLEAPENASRLDTRDIGPEAREEAIQALTDNDLGAEAVAGVWSKLYDAFLDRVVVKFDPGGRFKEAKGTNADALRPILTLLSMCEPKLVVTRKAGLEEGIDLKSLAPQLVFLDYYLNEKVDPGPGSPDPVEGEKGVNASMAFLNRIVSELPANGPAVVLMSSYAKVEQEAQAFRRGIDGGLFSSRFQFVQKGKLGVVKNKVTMEPEAAAALLDLTQCRTFAVALDEALHVWKRGIDAAVERIGIEVGNLQLRDFAYLVRFRLLEEGQPLSEYLEWFFGEVLLDRIGAEVDWADPAFAALDKPTDGPGRLIEGVFDGATGQIAEMFSSVRVDAREIVGARDRRLGDLYMAEGVPDEVQAVITPDCDLVVRNGSPRAARMLTVSGRLGPIGAPDVAVSDFIMRGGEPRSIEWNLKDVRTLAFGEERKHPTGMVHVGTLRPLYALELQRRALDDLGRVGLAIAPVLHFTSSCRAFVRSAEKLEPFDLRSHGPSTCSVIPSRGGSDRTRVVFHRSFVDRLLAAFDCLPETGEAAVDAWRKTAKTTNFKNALTHKLLVPGVTHGETVDGVLVVTGDKPTKARDALGAMCQIVVTPKPDAAT